MSFISRTARDAARLPALATLGIGVLLLALEAFRIDGTWHVVLFDDAMISMRFAEHLAAGHGFAWNIGEPPVEGFTNLGQVLWMALVHLAHVPQPLTGLVVALGGIACLVALVYVVAELVEELYGLDLGATPVWLTATCLPLIWWTARGMEVGAGALIVTTFVLVMVRDRDYVDTNVALLCMALAVLVRDDLVVPIIAALALGSMSWRRKLLGGAVFLAACMSFKLQFRWWTFHELIPLTAYLKLGGVALTTRLERGMLSLAYQVALGLWLPALAAISSLKSIRSGPFLLPAAVFGSTMAYSVFVGGDAFLGLPLTDRFICVGLPCGFVAAGWAQGWFNARTPLRYPATSALIIACVGLCSWLGSHAQLGGIDVALFVACGLAPAALFWGHRWPAAMACLACALPVLLELARPTSEIRLDLARDEERTVHGLALRAATAPDATIGVTPAGIIPYFAERRTCDLLGKVDPVVAKGPNRIDMDFYPGHSKGHLAESLARWQPDVIDEIFCPTAEDGRALMSDYGQVSWKLFVRRDTTKVDVDKLFALKDWDTAHGW